MSDTIRTIREFELPIGYEVKGETHRVGRMRAVLTGDILKCQGDPDLQSFIKTLPAATMSVDVGGVVLGGKAGLADRLKDSEVKLDPIAMHALTAFAAMQATLMLPRLIVSLGSLTRDLNREDIKRMYAPDVEYLMALKDEMDMELRMGGQPEEQNKEELPSGPLP